MKIMLTSIMKMERIEAFFIPIKGSDSSQIQQVINRKVLDLPRINAISLSLLKYRLPKEPCGTHYQYKD